MSGREPSEELFDAVTGRCRAIFESKLREYGPSWMAYRTSSLVDKLWIKARRIRSLEEFDDAGRVPEGREEEYLALVNYAAVALMRLRYGEELRELSGGNPLGDDAGVGEVDEEGILRLYDEALADARSVMLDKDHDYGEAWREMAIGSITDQILEKLLRIKRILDRDPDEGDRESALAAEFVDIVNYAVFAVAKLNER